MEVPLMAMLSMAVQLRVYRTEPDPLGTELAQGDGRLHPGVGGWVGGDHTLAELAHPWAGLVGERGGCASVQGHAHLPAHAHILGSGGGEARCVASVYAGPIGSRAASMPPLPGVLGL